jgi:hypothetical protein
MQKRRLAGASALGILVAVGLSGCMKMDMQLDLQSDDTVDGTMIIAVSAELAELTGQSPEDLAEQMQSEMVPVDEGEGEWSSKPYDDGEFVGSEITFEGAPLDTMGGEEATPESLTIVREGDEFVVSGVLDMTDTTGSAEDPMFAGMMDSFDIRVAVSFPGEVTEHNGELSGNTVTWVPVFGEVLELNARGSAIEGGGGGLPLLLLIGIGVGVLLLIALILFLVLRSRKRAPAVGPATAYPTAGGYLPPPPMPAYAPQDTAATMPAAPPESQAPPAPPGPTAPPEPSAEPKADQGPPPPPLA